VQCLSLIATWGAIKERVTRGEGPTAKRCSENFQSLLRSGRWVQRTWSCRSSRTARRVQRTRRQVGPGVGRHRRRRRPVRQLLILARREVRVRVGRGAGDCGVASARRGCRSRSASDIPPHTPWGSPAASACAAHSRRTGQRPQIAFAAASRAARRGPRSLSDGKNSAGSVCRQAASRQSHCSRIGPGSRPGYVTALPPPVADPGCLHPPGSSPWKRGPRPFVPSPHSCPPAETSRRGQAVAGPTSRTIAPGFRACPQPGVSWAGRSDKRAGQPHSARPAA